MVDLKVAAKAETMVVLTVVELAREMAGTSVARRADWMAGMLDMISAVSWVGRRARQWAGPTEVMWVKWMGQTAVG